MGLANMVDPKHAKAIEIESVQSFLSKLNSDAEFRNQFLDAPVGTLKKAHIELNSEDAVNLELAIGYLKDDIKHIFEMPAGSSEFLQEMGFGIKLPPNGESWEIGFEPGVKIV
jgi:hypothetical protein